MSTNIFPRAILLFFSLLAFTTGEEISNEQLLDKRMMTLQNDYYPSNYALSVFVAIFGNPLNDSITFNLMLPPTDDDMFLCSLPKSVERAKTDELGFDQYYHSIALLVRHGGNCTSMQKAAVVLEIQGIIKSVKHLILYEVDQDNDTQPLLPTIFVDSFVSTPKQIEKIGILYMFSNAARKLEFKMNMQPGEDASRHLIDPASETWSFPFQVQGRNSSNDNDFDNNMTDQGNFYWLRAVLFGLLIAAPCFRAAFLWYAGGGRFHWRRNEQGRVVGIRHIPPVPYWLAIGRPPIAGDIRDTLTEEQFAKLPRIKFQPSMRSSDDVDGNENDAQAEEPDLVDGNSNHNQSESLPETNACQNEDDMVSKDSLTPSCRSLDKDLERQSSPNVSMIIESESFKPFNNQEDEGNGSNYVVSPDSMNDPTSAANENVINGNEGSVISSLPTTQLPLPETVRSPAETEAERTCTICSICIEDFIANETLILLPRCQHAFHKECIHPWLLERQGCCPTCKTTALPDDNDRSNEDASSTSEF